MILTSTKFRYSVLDALINGMGEDGPGQEEKGKHYLKHDEIAFVFESGYAVVVFKWKGKETHRLCMPASPYQIVSITGIEGRMGVDLAP